MLKTDLYLHALVAILVCQCKKRVWNLGSVADVVADKLAQGRSGPKNSRFKSVYSMDVCTEVGMCRLV